MAMRMDLEEQVWGKAGECFSNQKNGACEQLLTGK